MSPKVTILWWLCILFLCLLLFLCLRNKFNQGLTAARTSIAQAVACSENSCCIITSVPSLGSQQNGVATGASDGVVTCIADNTLPSANQVTAPPRVGGVDRAFTQIAACVKSVGSSSTSDSYCGVADGKVVCWGPDNW